MERGRAHVYANHPLALTRASPGRTGLAGSRIGAALRAHREQQGIVAALLEAGWLAAVNVLHTCHGLVQLRNTKEE